MPQSHTGGGVVQQSRGGADARRIAADGAVDAESKRSLAGGGGVGGGVVRSGGVDQCLESSQYYQNSERVFQCW